MVCPQTLHNTTGMWTKCHLWTYQLSSSYSQNPHTTTNVCTSSISRGSKYQIHQVIHHSHHLSGWQLPCNNHLHMLWTNATYFIPPRSRLALVYWFACRQDFFKSCKCNILKDLEEYGHGMRNNWFRHNMNPRNFFNHFSLSVISQDWSFIHSAVAFIGRWIHLIVFIFSVYSKYRRHHEYRLILLPNTRIFSILAEICNFWTLSSLLI